MNHELITTKSSDSDYYVSDLIFVRDSYDEQYIENSMSLSGIFSNKNRDLSEFTDENGLTVGGQIHVNERRTYAEETTRDGVKYYKYHLVVPINHGLARQDKPLPASIPIQLTFNRSRSEKSLIQIINERTIKGSAQKWSYPNKVIPLINPILKCYFVESAAADRFYNKNKLYDVSLNFLDYSLRRELLMQGVSQYNLKLFEGLSLSICEITVFH